MGRKARQPVQHPKLADRMEIRVGDAPPVRPFDEFLDLLADWLIDSDERTQERLGRQGDGTDD